MLTRLSSTCRTVSRSIYRSSPVTTFMSPLRRWQATTSTQFKGWLALYLIAAGLATRIAKSELYARLKELYPNLMPAFHSDTMPVPNVDFINFAAMVFTVLGATALHWLRHDYPTLFRLPLPHPLIIAALAVCGLVAFPSYMGFLALGIAFFIALSMMLPGNKAIEGGHPVSYRLSFLTSDESRVPRHLCLLFALPVILALVISSRSWYPLTLPNDYYEIGDTFHTHAVVPFTGAGVPAEIDRSDVIACLKYQQAPDIPDWYMNGVLFDDSIPDDYPFVNPNNHDTTPCPLARTDTLMPVAGNLIHQTGEWQAQLGRLLFHHSYVFVPAKHLQQYGLTWEVPMLYGIGQTAFYAGMMKLFGTSLADYFNYYFVGIFLGIAWITWIIYAITRSKLASACAFMICTGCFYAITFEGTFLSAGFTPIRFAGIALQLASVLYLFRRQDYRGMLLSWIALVASYLWNSEFAIIGVIGQLLAVLAPALRLRLRTRFLFLALLVATLLASIVLKGAAEHDLFQNNGYGIFSIGTQSIKHWQFELLLVCVLAGVAALCLGLSRFPPAAAQARLSILPVLTLMMIKFVFTASPLHLYTTLSFVVPFALIYFPYWHSRINWPTGFGNRQHHAYLSLKSVLCLAAIGFFAFHGLSYYDGSQRFKNAFVKPFVVNAWSSLHDTIRTPVPEAPIEERVSALKRMLKPTDTVLILSPFDHIMAFYATPKRYCGNFEMLSNVVTRAQLNELAECVMHTPNILLVYDDALEIPCFPPLDYGFTDPVGCRGKQLAKESLTLLRDKLKTYLSKVGQTDNLTFYRLKTAPGS